MTHRQNLIPPADPGFMYYPGYADEGEIMTQEHTKYPFKVMKVLYTFHIHKLCYTLIDCMLYMVYFVIQKRGLQ